MGADPKTYKTPAGTQCVEFSLATNERRADAVETHWHDVKVYGRLAETMLPMLVTGVEVWVVGKIWVRKDKNNVRQVFIVADAMRACQPRKREVAPDYIPGDE